MNRKEGLKLLACFAYYFFFAAFISSAEQKNMIEEGGIEVTKEHMAASFTTALKAGWDFGDDIMIVLPVFYDQLSGTAGKITVVEGEPGDVVYQGKKALYMEGNFSGFYIRVSPANSGKGEKYRMSFRAKGEGKISVNFVGFGESAACEIIPKSVNISDKWEEYTMDFEVKNEKVLRIGPAIYVTGKAWVDDIFFGKAAEQ